MKNIVQLLNEKNRVLKKFYTLSKSEYYRMTDGDYSQVEEFYRNRDGLLEIVQKIDYLIDREVVDPAVVEAYSEPERKAIREAIGLKDVIVNSILEQDLKIMSLVEKAKSKLLTELQAVARSKTVIGKYKSGKPAPSIDEEA